MITADAKENWMLLKITCATIAASFLLTLLFSCSSKDNTLGNSNLEIDTLSIEIGNKALSNYNTLANDIYQSDGMNFMVCYNYLSHEIDFFNLDSSKYLRTLKLDPFGPNAVRAFSFLHHYQGKLIVLSGLELAILDMNGKLLGKRLTPKWFESNGTKYRLAVSMFINNFDTGFGIDSVNHKIIHPIYPLLKKSNPDYFKSMLLCSLDFDSLKPIPMNAHYPVYLQNHNLFEEKDRPQILVKGDSVVFSFASHPDIFIYRMTTMDQITKKIECKKYPPIMPSNSGKYSNSSSMTQYFFNEGSYLPLKFDPYKKLFYRIFILPKAENQPDSTDTRKLLVLNQNFEVLKEVSLPAGLDTDFFPTPSGMIFQFEKYFKNDHTYSLALLRIKGLQSKSD